MPRFRPVERDPRAEARAKARMRVTRRTAAFRRVDERLRAFHAALVSLPIPERLRRLVGTPAPGPRTRDTEDR